MIVSPARDTYGQTLTLRAMNVVVALLTAFVLYRIGELRHQVLFFYGAAIVIAAGVAAFVLLGKSQLTIHDEGLRRVSAFGEREIEWQNVKEYRYREVVQQSGAAMHVGGLIGAMIFSVLKGSSGKNEQTVPHLQLVGNDGTTVWITPFFKDSSTAIDSILAKAHERLRPQVENEIGATGAIFGPLRLNVRELQWKSKDPVPLGELASAHLAGSKLIVKQTGKFLSLVSVRSDKVPNVLLLLEEMEKLGVAGLRSDTLGSLFHR